MSTIKVFLTSFCLFLVVFYFWKSPWSPMIDNKIQHHIVHTEVSEAIALLEWRAEYAFDAKKKRQDLWRAAQLSFLQGKDKQRSRRLLEICLHLPFFEHTTQARIYLGAMFLEEDSFKGVSMWKEALLVDPTYIDSANMWVRIASEYELIGEYEEAIFAWNKALSYDSVQNTAHLALGKLKIKSNPKKAIQHFEIVKTDSFMERTRAAELGEKLAQWELEKER